jgi:hypothetical protein
MYLLDANVLIDAANRHYPFDVCPGFWAWLDSALHLGDVASVAQVRLEVMKKGDGIAEWVRTRRAFFPDPDAATVDAMRVVAEWTMDGDRIYTMAAKQAFLGKADYILVAAGLASGAVVVTHETSQPRAPGRVKIPDVCAALGVASMTTVDMLRSEGVRLVVP